MSIFRVNLNNSVQGVLDINPSTSAEFATSIQRTIFAMGPGKTNRLLKDGDTFTDCNYWKRFAYPQTTLDKAFISVVSDDGSIWSDMELESTFLKVYSLSILNGTTYTAAANQANILTDTGGYAIFTQITNGGAGSVTVQLNGNSSSVFTLTSGSTQLFNAGELAISSVAFANSSGSTNAVTVMASVRVQANS